MGSVALSKRNGNIDKLPDKMRMFCHEYMIDFNTVRAVIAAGYSKKSAAARGWQLLRNPKIQRYLGKIQKEQIEKLDFTAEEVLKQLCYCATRDGKQLFDSRGRLVLNHRIIDGEVQGATVHDLPKQITAAIDGVKQRIRRYTKDEVEVEEVETEIKLVGKGGAIDMAMKYFSLFAPQQIDGTIQIDWVGMLKSTTIVDPIEAKITKLLEE